jgi:hypothetical protein
MWFNIPSSSPARLAAAVDKRLRRAGVTFTVEAPLAAVVV